VTGSLRRQPGREVSATDAAIAALEGIALDELRPGDRLPSEASAAARLGVSRLTVREAVRALEARGIVALHKGRRPVVRPLDGALVGDFFRTGVRRDPNALFELLEVRQALEVHIARVAAERAPRSALAAMGAAIDAYRAAGDDEALAEADVRFHEALAGGTGNGMLIHMVEALAEPLRASRRHSLRGRRASGRPLASVADDQRGILDAVAERDPDRAAEQMRAHLRATERDLHDALRGVSVRSPTR
jgi:GntR family transcriptional repressor for pyruvate dehydrogenase complex